MVRAAGANSDTETVSTLSETLTEDFPSIFPSRLQVLILSREPPRDCLLRPKKAEAVGLAWTGRCKNSYDLVGFSKLCPVYQLHWGHLDGNGEGEGSLKGWCMVARSTSQLSLPFFFLTPLSAQEWIWHLHTHTHMHMHTLTHRAVAELILRVRA